MKLHVEIFITVIGIEEVSEMSDKPITEGG